MNNKFRSLFFIFLFVFLSFPKVFSMDKPSEEYLVQASPKFCKHGLHLQPNGPFAVMLFNDDAAGTHLGVILYEAGLGEYWGDYKRFWQEKGWAVDVSSFAWDKSGNFLYISTRSIYGTGHLYELNLKKKEYCSIFPNENLYPPVPSTSFSTTIVNNDRKKSCLEFEVGYYDFKKKKPMKSLLKYQY